MSTKISLTTEEGSIIIQLVILWGIMLLSLSGGAMIGGLAKGTLSAKTPGALVGANEVYSRFKKEL